MTSYVSCDHARDRLEGFLDGELSVEDQVGVEAHLRWCRTCAAHVDDLRLIGVAVRDVPGTVLTGDDSYALASLQAGVLARVRAERDQAFVTRWRATFSDTRLLFPALGATMAVMICFVLTYSVQVTASSQLTEILLAKARLRAVGEAPASYAVAMLEPSADPGSDQNPLRLDDAFASPQLLNRELAMRELEGIKDDEAAFAVAAVLSRKGRIETYELLKTYSGASTAASSVGNVDSVLSAVRQSRFSPAQAHDGLPVAVAMLWYIEKTTVGTRITTTKPRVPAVPAVPVARRPVVPELVPPPTPDDVIPAVPGRSGNILDSTVA